MAIQAYAPTIGGGELQLELLVPLLRGRGVFSSVLTRSVAGCARRDVVAGGDVYRSSVAGESPLASVVYVIESLTQLVRHWRTTDVVHAHGALSPGTIALAARLLGKPCVVTILGAGPPGDLARLRRKPAGRLRLGMLARRARFVALSAEVAAELRTVGVPPAHVSVVANGVDLASYRPAPPSERSGLRKLLGLDEDRCYGVFVGRLHPVKSVDTLLHALSRATGMDLLIVGDGAERQSLEALARELQVADRVRFVGSTTRVADYLKAADVFLLPSLGEGMPNALLEGMACGLACVASSMVGGVDELLGQTHGLTVAVGDSAAWAATMQRLATDPSLRRELGGAAARRARARYSIDITADRLTALYHELATPR